ncbi:ATP synthase subunit I [Paraglaciecola hydrolytica]|uniref:ATP synthase I n=1 Tax=Paraglaciecola hydrolytica TaxID=1799789 RepID=A0A136A498_9ALTE|nr:ATP synthase subunit I [Paraglaciecola hydrolytica]KXI30039.1 ATP synthase I [Paraglaciecola hydrolytica]
MAANLVQEGQQLARKVLFYQSILAVIIALLFTLMIGENSGISSSYGGLIAIVPHFIFAHYAFRFAGARQNKLVVRSFNKGSKIKFLLTIVMFGFAYQWPSLNIMALMVTYITVLIGQWPIMILVSRVKKSA